MGFRSTFITTDTGINWPLWFYDKWNSWVHFPNPNSQGNISGCISSKFEVKIGITFRNLEIDIKKVLIENENNEFCPDNIVLIWLHECGGITRAEISPDNIRFMRPKIWLFDPDDIYGHYYCNECTDVNKAEIAY